MSEYFWFFKDQDTSITSGEFSEFMDFCIDSWKTRDENKPLYKILSLGKYDIEKYHDWKVGEIVVLENQFPSGVMKLRKYKGNLYIYLHKTMITKASLEEMQS